MYVVATAGHVDHGKSTMIRAITGMDPDRLVEEHARGMTIDLGYAWMRLPSGRTVAFVDVPGHERFVTTMLAGVGPVPAVVLVVAADEGWMPQTAEHVDALLALGVRHGLLVISRCDVAEPGLALHDVRAQLATTPLAGIPAVCISAVTGAGLDDLRAALDSLVTGLPPADCDADVRMWVDRAFTIRGAGTVVTGTLPKGTINSGDELALLRADGSVVRSGVRGLQTLGEPSDSVNAVARVAVNLRGVSRDAVRRGDALLTPGTYALTDLVDVRLHPVRSEDLQSAALPAELVLHIGSAAVTARVRPLGGDTARLRLYRPLPLRVGDRAALRDPGRRQVLAGLSVLDVRPPQLRRRGSAARRAAELTDMEPVPSATAELARRGWVRGADLVAMGVSRADIAATRERVPAAGDWLVDPHRAAAAAAALAEAVAAHDASDPLDPGLPIEAARRAVALPDARLLEPLLRHVGRDDLVLDGGRVMRSTTRGLPAPVRAAAAELRARLERDPFAAPDAAHLAELGLGERELSALVRAGALMRIADGVVLLPGADDLAVEILSRLDGEFTLSQARQTLRTSRRVAVPLLELLARNGRTERTPTGRHRLR